MPTRWLRSPFGGYAQKEVIMPITSEKVLRKMNEIQSKGGEPIGHWHILRRWLLEDEQVQENFFDAVENDPDMTPEQKEYWLAQKPPNTSVQPTVLTHCPNDGNLLLMGFCDQCKSQYPHSG